MKDEDFLKRDPTQPVSKEEMAAWMGYDTVERMDKDHDDVHWLMCHEFGLKS